LLCCFGYGRLETAPRARRAHRLFDGTSRTLIGPPPRFQPSRSNQVRGWNTISASHVGGPRHRNASSPYSAQPGNEIALENQSSLHVDAGPC